MGSIFSSSRDSIFRPFAFPAPSPSYDEYMDGLEWVSSIPIYWKRLDSSLPTILFSHGNNCDLGQTRAVVHLLCKELKVNVVAYDYPGYGLHEGSTDEQGCHDTINQVYKHLVENGVTDITLMGQSVGTGPTAWLAKELCQRKTPPHSVVMLSPFRSAVSVLSPTAAAVSYSSHVVSERTLDIFDSYYHLQSVTCPVQIIAGTNDGVTPYDQACALQNVLSNPLPIYTLEGAGHNDVFSPYYKDQVIAGISCAI